MNAFLGHLYKAMSFSNHQTEILKLPNFLPVIYPECTMVMITYEYNKGLKKSGYQQQEQLFVLKEQPQLISTPQVEKIPFFFVKCKNLFWMPATLT